MIAIETGHLELADDYFAEAALIDLRDLAHDTRNGLHIASLAGAWIAVVAGFGGMRDHDGTLAFSPRLPERLARLSFRVIYRGRCVEVSIEHRHARYRLIHGEPLEVIHHGEPITVSTKRSVTRSIPRVRTRRPPVQPPGRAPARRQPPR